MNPLLLKLIRELHNLATNSSQFDGHSTHGAIFAIEMRMIKPHYTINTSISIRTKIIHNLQIQKRSLPLY